MPIDYDAELQRHNEVLRRAADVQHHDRVLDIGCGFGLTTRQAARAARSGSALGVDVSPAMIERARELARADGLGNITFELADAQVHPFPPARFDLAISRFGTMFFADPVAAFTNIGRALRPAGRLVMIVWQAQKLNEWSVAIRQALDADTSGGPDPFTLADPPVVREILQAAGFTRIGFTDVDVPAFYGPDVATAVDWISAFSCANEGMKQPDAVERLRRMLTEHLRDDGVWFESRAWIITASRG